MSLKTEKTETGQASGPGTRTAETTNEINTLSQELADLGITAVEVTYFEWSGYRYSNARDAIAAANREKL